MSRLFEEEKTMKRIVRLGIALLAAALVAGTLLAGKPKDRAQKAEAKGPAARLSEAPASARALKNPYEGDEQAAKAGRKLFLRHCAPCHGREGYGTGHAANLHSAAFRKAPAGVLFWAIRNGRLRKGMPAWSDLPDQQKWQLVTYLKTLK
jgi:mono/diheme cytochrome c family protein